MVWHRQAFAFWHRNLYLIINDTYGKCAGVALGFVFSQIHTVLYRKPPMMNPAANGNAVVLDGKDGCVRLPEGIIADLHDMTIACWVYIEPPVVGQRVFDFGGYSGVNMFLASRDLGSARVIGSEQLPGGRWFMLRRPSKEEFARCTSTAPSRKLNLILRFRQCSCGRPRTNGLVARRRKAIRTWAANLMTFESTMARCRLMRSQSSHR